MTRVVCAECQEDGSEGCGNCGLLPPHAITISDEDQRARRMLAQRDADLTGEQNRHAATLVILANLERALRQIGGTLSDSQTDALRAATRHLSDHGVQRASGPRLYAPVAPPWADDPPPWLRGK